MIRIAWEFDVKRNMSQTTLCSSRGSVNTGISLTLTWAAYLRLYLPIDYTHRYDFQLKEPTQQL